MRSKVPLTTLKLLLSVALFAWLFTKIDVNRFIGIAVQAAPVYIFAGALLFVAQALLAGLRWQRIVLRLGGQLPIRQAVHWVFVGQFFNQALPTSIGGDAIRIWQLHRHGAAPGQAFASVAVERSSGLLILGLMISASLPWVDTGPNAHLRWLLALLGPVLLLGLAGFCAGERLIKLLPVKALVGPATALASAFKKVAASGLALTELVILGALSALAGIAAAWAIGLGIGIDLPFLPYIVFIGGTALVSVLPISLGGWGLREITMVGFLGTAGVNTEQALTLSIIWGVLPLAVSLPSGLMFLLKWDRPNQPPLRLHDDNASVLQEPAPLRDPVVPS